LIRILHKIDDPYSLSDEEFFTRGNEALWLVNNVTSKIEAGIVNIMTKIFAQK
jgi:hypothetical protein